MTFKKISCKLNVDNIKNCIDTLKISIFSVLSVKLQSKQNKMETTLTALIINAYN